MLSLRKERLEFLQSIDNDVNYYIPLEDLDNFLTNPDINIERYRCNFKEVKNELIQCRMTEFEQDINAIEYFTIKNKCIDEYTLNNNEYFYKDEIFLDDTFYEWKFKWQ